MNLLDILKESGGYFEGHTEFKNGQHGDGWIEKGFVIRNPKYLKMFTEAQSDQISRFFPDVELLVGPIVNGSIIASHVSANLNKELAVTYNLGDGFEFHRMNLPKKELKTVLVEDLLFTGNSVRENVNFLRKYGLNVLGVSAWINRLGKSFDDLQIINLIDPPFKNFTKENCDLCRSSIDVKYTNIRE